MKTIAITKESEGLELEVLDAQINSMMKFSQVKVSGQGRMRICKVCGKEGQRSNIMDHIEAHHITGFSHNCGICGKTSRYMHMYNYLRSNVNTTTKIPKYRVSWSGSDFAQDWSYTMF